MISQAKQAMINAGLTKGEKLKTVINGVETITPIVAHLIKSGSVDHVKSLQSALIQIKQLKSELIKKAVNRHFRITQTHFAAINRLAIKLYCDNHDHEDYNTETISLLCAELYELDELHAEKMLQEITPEKHGLQFVAVSTLAATLTTNIIQLIDAEDAEDAINEIMVETIELVDKHIDEIYDEFIEPTYDINIRKHLIESAAQILNATLQTEIVRKGSSASYSFNSALIQKKFEFAYKTYIEAITINASTRG